MCSNSTLILSSKFFVNVYTLSIFIFFCLFITSIIRSNNTKELDGVSLGLLIVLALILLTCTIHTIITLVNRYCYPESLLLEQEEALINV